MTMPMAIHLRLQSTGMTMTSAQTLGRHDILTFNWHSELYNDNVVVHNVYKFTYFIIIIFK